MLDGGGWYAIAFARAAILSLCWKKEKEKRRRGKKKREEKKEEEKKEEEKRKKEEIQAHEMMSVTRCGEK